MRTSSAVGLQAIIFIEMERVVVMGRGAAGKSTAAARLGRLTGLPVIELDKHFWRPGLTPMAPGEWTQLQQMLAAQDRWIMDGDLGPYGGLPRPQHVHGHLPWDRFDSHFSGRIGKIELTGTVPVCKLHGSLNWQHRGTEIGLYRDQRLAYRHGGTAAIIPPTAEKQAEPWLSSVWTAAETILATSHVWIVVGYSLKLLSAAVGFGRVKTAMMRVSSADADRLWSC